VQEAKIVDHVRGTAGGVERSGFIAPQEAPDLVGEFAEGDPARIVGGLRGYCVGVGDAIEADRLISCVHRFYQKLGFDQTEQVPGSFMTRLRPVGRGGIARRLRGVVEFALNLWLAKAVRTVS
jgi:hypothetical protein